MREGSCFQGLFSSSQMTSVAGMTGPLQSGGTGDFEALGLKKWAGETVGAYYQLSKTEGRFGHKSISGAQTSAQWIVTGRRTSAYFDRGEDILEDAGTHFGITPNYQQNYQTAEVVVQIDRPDVAATFLDRQDSILSHYDHQAEIRRQQGQRLARMRDLIRLICVGRGSHRIDGGSGVLDTFLEGQKAAATALAGTTDFSQTLFGTTTAQITATEAAIALMAQRFDEFDVPKDGRVMWVAPAEYRYLITYLEDFMDRDFNGMGSKALGVIPMIHGFEVCQTNNMPTSTYTNPAGLGGGTAVNSYAFKGTNLKALFSVPDSIAEVRLGSGFGAESAYIPNRMGTLVNMFWTGGHKELRPEACGSLYSTTVPPSPNT